MSSSGWKTCLLAMGKRPIKNKGLMWPYISYVAYICLGCFTFVYHVQHFQYDHDSLNLYYSTPAVLSTVYHRKLR